MRFFHKWYARVFGYFWLPCPVCREEFGGHEISGLWTSALVSEDGHAYRVCPKPQCSHEATVLNIKNGHAQSLRNHHFAITLRDSTDDS